MVDADFSHEPAMTRYAAAVIFTAIAWLAVPAHAGLFVIDTDFAGGTLLALDNDADDIADVGVTSHTYSLPFAESGVDFTLSFDVTANGGFLHNDQGNQDDAIGIWSSTVGEPQTGSNNDSVNRASESFTVDNVQISGVSGGTATFDGITRVGLFSAIGPADAGSFGVGGGILSILNWDDLNDGDSFDGGNLDTGSGNSFDLASAFAALGGTGPIDSFELAHPGTSSNAWRLDAVEFSVSTMAFTSVPEPTVCAMFMISGLGLLGRRKRDAS